MILIVEPSQILTIELVHVCSLVSVSSRPHSFSLILAPFGFFLFCFHICAFLRPFALVLTCLFASCLHISALVCTRSHLLPISARIPAHSCHPNAASRHPNACITFQDFPTCSTFEREPDANRT
ncbi:hypothetical protein M405DRAFT_141239 [Rhizopogon salebrosus TDB-379]|nr:hypothetical protein M405DRAFT_141239 [Rhizopogon salebrosus TDB-379]